MDNGMITAEVFQSQLESAMTEFDSSGLMLNDELDGQNVDVCLLVPEQFVSLLIGKAGVNINLMKGVTTSTISFQKRDNSALGLRKCFVSGPVASVTRAIHIIMSFIGDTPSVGVVVSHNAAGAVIGKGGENLKNVREHTGCHVSMEKSAESNPSFGGRCLTLRHAEKGAMVRALYMVIRSAGFASPTSAEDQKMTRDAQAQYSPYGPASTSHDDKRYSPYGNTTSGDVCAVHGKKRGRQNLQPSPAVQGQFVCLSTDPCKGAMNMDAMAGMGAMGGMGMNAMGGGFGAVGGFGGQQGQQQMFGGQQQQSMSNFCAVHGKKRGPNNLQAHPSSPGLFVCLETDACKVGNASA